MCLLDWSPGPQGSSLLEEEEEGKELEEEEEGGAKEGAPEVKGQQGWGQQPVHEASNLRGSGGESPHRPSLQRRSLSHQHLCLNGQPGRGLREPSSREGVGGRGQMGGREREAGV